MNETLQMIRTLLVDDDRAARERLLALLEGENGFEIVGECEDGLAAVASVRCLQPDLLFLEVELPGLDGFEVVDRHGVDPGPAVVFVSRRERYAVDAFEVHAVDYLVKPLSTPRLRETVDRVERVIERAAALRRLRERTYLTRIPVKQAGRVELVDVDEVDWIEAADNYVCLHVGSRTHLVRGTMSEMERKLDPNRFVRIHRSRIVNVDRVRAVHPQSSGDSVIVLRNGARLTSSRTYGRKRRRLYDNLSA